MEGAIVSGVDQRASWSIIPAGPCVNAFSAQVFASFSHQLKTLIKWGKSALLLDLTTNSCMKKLADCPSSIQTIPQQSSKESRLFFSLIDSVKKKKQDNYVSLLIFLIPTGLNGVTLLNVVGTG